jgi:hypothetical protein
LYRISAFALLESGPRQARKMLDDLGILKKGERGKKENDEEIKEEQVKLSASEFEISELCKGYINAQKEIYTFESPKNNPFLQTMKGISR